RDQDSRIMAERFPSNRGVFAAVRRCLELCDGELLCAIAADDYISNPRYFELVVAALQRFPQAAAAYGRVEIVDANDGRQLGLMGAYIPARGARGGQKSGSTGISMRFIPPN